MLMRIARWTIMLLGLVGGARAMAGGEMAAFPILAYAPETRGIGGVWLEGFARADSLARPQRLALYLMATQERQAELGLKPELWLAGGRWGLTGEAGYQKWPATSYGVGPRTPSAAAADFTAERVKLELRLRRRLASGFHAGPCLLQVRESITTHEPGYAFAHEEGSDTGLGLELGLDRREHAVAPRSGCYHQLRALRHGTYSRWLADLRGYRALGPGVLAGQAALEGRGGEPGYRALPRLGDFLRADETLRHVDRWLAAARLEWRQPSFITLPGRAGGWLSRRSAFVLFAEAGTVAAAPGALVRHGLLPSLGLGGRFALLPEARLNARADLAFGREGAALRIKVGEEF